MQDPPCTGWRADHSTRARALGCATSCNVKPPQTQDPFQKEQIITHLKRLKKRKDEEQATLDQYQSEVCFLTQSLKISASHNPTPTRHTHIHIHVHTHTYTTDRSSTFMCASL